MAGHTLLKILISFTFVILCNSPLYNVVFPWLIVVFVVILEILIAFLQAYVFMILLCIYLNDIQKEVH